MRSAFLINQPHHPCGVRSLETVNLSTTALACLHHGSPRPSATHQHLPSCRLPPRRKLSNVLVRKVECCTKKLQTDVELPLILNILEALPKSRHHFFLGGMVFRNSSRCHGALIERFEADHLPLQ